MIRGMEIKGFKSLLNFNSRFARLNVLVGGNAAGKSSVVQAMLLLRQSCDSDGDIASLKLNGPLFIGGKATDVCHPAAGREITLTVTMDGENGVEESLSVVARYEADTPNSRELVIADAPLKAIGPLVVRHNGSFAYLNAERIGPRVRYALPVDEAPITGVLGVQGEYVAHALTSSTFDRSQAYAASWSTKLVKLAGDDESVTSDSLKEQARFALEYVIPGAGVDGRRYEEVDNAGLFYHHGDIDNIRPTHIGFGLSYSLPVIVAPLIVEAPGVVIVENPEAHLHPLGQSRIGRYLALAASDGPQIFIETHSDHVINGIRRAVRMGWIAPNEVLFHFFEKQPDAEASSHTVIEIDRAGALSAWPQGFFDQIENDLAQL
jgi:predicted ATPase